MFFSLEIMYKSNKLKQDSNFAAKIFMLRSENFTKSLESLEHCTKYIFEEFCFVAVSVYCFSKCDHIRQWSDVVGCS